MAATRATWTCCTSWLASKSADKSEAGPRRGARFSGKRVFRDRWRELRPLEESGLARALLPGGLGGGPPVDHRWAPFRGELGLRRRRRGFRRRRGLRRRPAHGDVGLGAF